MMWNWLSSEDLENGLVGKLLENFPLYKIKGVKRNMYVANIQIVAVVGRINIAL